MTLKEFAERLNGTEYNGYPIFSKEDIGIAKENGFVIVTGASDDLQPRSLHQSVCLQENHNRA